MFPTDLCQASDQIQMTGSPPNGGAEAISDTEGPLRKEQRRWIDERGGGIYIGVDAPNA